MINWNTIETVFLDMDGTLLDLHFDNYFWLEYLPEVYSRAHNLSVENARAHLIHQFNAERGTLNWYCLDYWSEQTGLDIGKLKQDVSHKICFRSGAVEFLDFLNGMECSVALVTNAHRKSLSVKLDKTGLQSHVDDIIISHDLNLPKENILFWKALNRQLPFNNKTTLFIDDSVSVLQSASQYGIQHLFSIGQPDSEQEPLAPGEFTQIHAFEDIMPSKSGNQSGQANE